MLKSLLGNIKKCSERAGFKRLVRDQKGWSLVEVLVAVAILAVVGVAFLSALTTGYLALVVADEDTVAESLTRTEFESIKNAGYPIRLVALNPNPALSEFLSHKPVLNDLYAVDIEVAELGDESEDRPVQLITVHISHQGEVVLTTQTYKVDANRNYL
jgi:prepilin-type N-terminal cleavage/methylation domain-containing protein